MPTLGNHARGGASFLATRIFLKLNSSRWMAKRKEERNASTRIKKPPRERGVVEGA